MLLSFKQLKMGFVDSMLQKGDKLKENTTKFHVSKCVTCSQVDWQSRFCVKPNCELGLPDFCFYLKRELQAVLST